MKPGLTRVLRVVYEGEPDPKKPWNTRRTRLAAVVLYPLEVKRKLATVDTAKARAIKLAGELIERCCHRPPRLEALRCSAEVVEFDLQPFGPARWSLEDGTKVWITEVDRAPHCPSWPERRND